MVEAHHSAGVRVENLMIAANANTVFKALDFDRKARLVAYAASNQVLILDPFHTTESEGHRLSTPKVLFGLTGHTTRINAVQWLTPNIIVSIGGDEKVIIAWTRQEGAAANNPDNWKATCRLQDAHDSTINYLTTLKSESPREDLYFTTMCSAGALKLWTGAADAEGTLSVSLKSTLLFGRNL